MAAAREFCASVKDGVASSSSSSSSSDATALAVAVANPRNVELSAQQRVLEMRMNTLTAEIAVRVCIIINFMLSYK